MSEQSGLLPQLMVHLERLVAMDTRNPPRRPQDSGLMDYLTTHLAGFNCTLSDHGDGCLSLLAVRGQPKVLFNVHMDTVPAADWEQDPFSLTIEQDRAIGLGACDIKGAAAGLLAAASQTSGDAALLFTTDEEAGSSTCIREFLSTDHGFSQVVVAEPTGCQALTRHRGIATATIGFRGTAGHASAASGSGASAVHKAVRWCAAALDLATVMQLESSGDLAGVRLNLGRIEGGIKPNMIAPSAEVRFGTRPPPGMDGRALLERFRSLAAREDESRDSSRHSFSEGFIAPGFDGSEALAAHLGIEQCISADFWTEAALFAQAGLQAIVYGPGHIEQAHTVGEWVALEQLQRAAQNYLRWLGHGN